MGKPTKQELETALRHARHMREQGEDLFYMAKSLLNLNYRRKFLERVMDAARLYLHSGEGGPEHAALLKAIEAAERAFEEPGGDHEVHPW